MSKPVGRERNPASIQVINSYFALVISLAFLILLEIPLKSSLILICNLVISTTAGRAAARHTGFGELGIGPALIIGASLQVFGGQVLLWTGLQPTISHWLVLGLMSISVISTLSTRSRNLISDWSLPHLVDLHVVVPIAIMAFALRHPWALAFALPVVAYERIAQRSHLRPMAHILLIAMTSIGWLTSLLIRPTRWWYFFLTGDTGFFESIGWTTAHWGIFEHPGLTGGSIAGYHWFSYSYLGVMSHISGLDPWDAITKFGLPLVQTALASVLLTSFSARRHCATSDTAWMITAMVVVGSGLFRFDSAGFGLLSGMTLIALIAIRQQRNLSGVMCFSLLSLVALTTIMSKATSGLVVGAVLALRFLIEFLRTRRMDWLSIGSFFFAGIFSYLAFFQNSQFTDAGLTTKFLSPKDVVVEFLIGTPFIGWGIPIFILGFRQLKSPSNALAAELRSFAVPSLIATIIVSQLAFFAQYQQQVAYFTYFMVLAISCWMLLFSRGASPVNWRSQIPGISSILFFISLAFGFVFPVLLNRFARTAILGIVIGSDGLEIASDLFPYLIALTLLCVFAFRGAVPNHHAQLLLVVAVTFGLLAGAQLDRGRRAIIWGYDVATNWSLNDSAMPNDDLRRVGTFIRESTPESMVLATNDFCCFGADWWEIIAADVNDYVSGSQEWIIPLRTTEWGRRRNTADDHFFKKVLPDVRLGGDNYLLAAESRRRMLVQGLKHQTAVPNSDQVRRMSLSLAFANSPNASDVEYLKDYGVGGFVINEALTSHRDWNQFAIERFRSGPYRFLELK